MAPSVGHQRRQGRSFNTGNPTQAEHTAGQRRTGGAGGYKAVRFAAAHLQHPLYGGAVDLLAHTHHRALVIRNHFRLFLQDQPVLHVFIVAQERLDFIQLARQDDGQMRILPQCSQCAFYRCFRCQVSTHRVNVDRHD